MTGQLFRVSGAVVSSRDGLPVRGAKVAVYDRDFWRKQPLGTSITGNSGDYEVRFSLDDFTGPGIRLERAPDVFVEVWDGNGTRLASTEDSVVVDAGPDTRIDVRIDQPPGPDSGRVGVIGGQEVDLPSAAALRVEELLTAYRFALGRKAEFERPELVRRALPWLFKPPVDDCGFGAILPLLVLLEERGVDTTDIDVGDDFPAGTTVQSFFTDRIEVRYTTDVGSPHRVDPTVPAADSPYQLPGGGPVVGTLRAALASTHPDNTVLAPTYVQKVGLLAEYALDRFLAAAFRDPRNGAARLQYRILQMPANIAGQTNSAWSHVEVGPANTDDQNAGTVPHEMFHQVQFRYSSSAGGGIGWAVLEGGARFIEDMISDPRNRWVRQSQDIFDNPANSLLDVGGVKNPIRYAFALLWKYYSEQHSTQVTPADEPAIGIDAHRTMLQQMGTAAGDPGLGYSVTALRTARSQQPWYGQFDRFSYYDTARTELGSNETTWGNYLVANWLHGSASPVTDRRFDYLEDEDAVGFGGEGAAGRLALKSPLVQASDVVALAQGGDVSLSVTGVAPWAARYYRVIPAGGGSAPRMLRITFTASGALTDPLVQILRLGPSGLVDLHRMDSTSFTKTINMSGLTEAVVIVGTRDTGGDYTVRFTEVSSASDVMVTRWNSRAGTEYEIDPIGWSWTWISPDVMVDNDDDLLRDGQVFFDQNNKLKIRLRNRGNAAATGISVQFWYQKATTGLSTTGWIPVTDTAGTVQTVTGASLAPGAEQWFTVNWAPANDGTNHPHWCVKARITVPGDPNTDDKLVLSNFGNVVVSTGDRFDLLLRHPELWRSSQLLVVPHGHAPTVTIVREPSPGENQGELCSCGPDSVLPPLDRASMATLQVRRGHPVEGGGAEGGPPVDPDTLPPGADPDKLVTVAHWVDGQVVGGVTYEISE
ncbi:hypothetical protein ACTVZO_07405 [Streptomyces sp. IBSNAI002]|uniref:hypothetical protein n=1 Tax=Streptomyces sp. IBSNAI002 TaxID=3457500 RepID=UPI003FD5D3DF